MSIHAHDAGANRGWERVLYPLYLELQTVLSCPFWILGTKLSSSEIVALATEPLIQPEIAFS